MDVQLVCSSLSFTESGTHQTVGGMTGNNSLENLSNIKCVRAVEGSGGGEGWNGRSWQKRFDCFQK